MFVAEFHHQMLTPLQVNNPVGERQERKLQDHQLLQMRVNHAEPQRRVCYLFFFLLKKNKTKLVYISSALLSWIEELI